MKRPERRGTQALRQIEVMRYLAQAQAWCTVQEIVEHTGCGYRTIYRDIEQLIDIGVPIERDETRQLGCRLRKSRMLRWLFDGETA